MARFTPRHSSNAARYAQKSAATDSALFYITNDVWYHRVSSERHRRAAGVSLCDDEQSAIREHHDEARAREKEAAFAEQCRS